ncbi:MAG: PQQ-binding-like beta-propeller repeat protein [Planctomyces sp.]|nr:PQQ-binding-like beta-propeller repeat protein [Planctomyces sp.]
MGWLPEELPKAARPRWSVRVPGDGLGGLAAAEGVVVLGCRDATDARDVFVCLDGATGLEFWTASYAAPGAIDYGNAPRATPVIHEGRVWTFGAFGHVHCYDLATGEVVWARDLARDCQTPRLDWGLAGSPLLVDGRLIVQPGGLKAGIVALNAETGETLWQSAGGLPGHSSFVLHRTGEASQLIGYDRLSLGGWDLSTGERRWSIVPPLKGDFNVPTPLVLNDRIIVSTENNGTRSYALDARGIPEARPTGRNIDLIPDSSTPVAMEERIYGVANGLFCLSAASGLEELWRLEEPEFYVYASLIASPRQNRLLVLTSRAELVLVQDEGSQGRVLSRLSLRDDGSEALSHPALVGGMLYYRIGRDVAALPLEGSATR